jgi:LPPG:FO 2-phospho-L-lactate transferase
MARRSYIALTGGVGGAKLALGLSQLLAPEQLSFLVNTGDDFEHLGLHVSPDIDTLVYTLAGEANPETGWGRRDETWQFMDALERLGGETWFRLGDRDLALHVERTRRLDGGVRLTEVTREIAAAFGVRYPILPMSDRAVRTIIATAEGELAFQHYFVRERCAPQVTGFRFDGAEAAAPSPEVEAAFDDPDLAGIVICPSNPFVSVDPILAVADIRQRLEKRRVPVVAVSPIIAGAAIKGPTAKMMRELDIPSDAVAVARHYRGLLDGFVLDQQDGALAHAVIALGVEVSVAQTLMVTLADRIDLAEKVLQFTNRLG